MLATSTSAAVRAAGARPWLSICSNGALRQRWFSASPARKADHIITFTETSNPELTQLLDTFREKVILPTYLSPEQRRKLTNPKIKQYLQNDPITMEIDGVVHKFRYINQVADLPNTHKTLSTAVKSMKTPADFRNIRPLLEGCSRARRKVQPEMYGTIIRRAAMNHSLSVVLECIKAAEKTGFKLNRSEHINDLLAWIQWPAIRIGFKEDRTLKALKQVSFVIDLLESDNVHAPTYETKGAMRFYRDPQVLAARLHMAAARAVYHTGGQDVDGKVTRYADELVTLWPEDKGLLDLQPDEAYQDANKMRYLLGRSTFLWVGSPVLNGLTLAAQVVDPGLAMQLQNRADKVEEEVKAALESPQLKPTAKGLSMYKALFQRDESMDESADEGEETA